MNGEDFDVAVGMTLESLMRELQVEPQAVAAEVNLKVICKRDYGGLALNEGDSVEIVRFVGGG